MKRAMKPLIATPDDVWRIEECARLCCEEHGEERVGGPLNWPHYRDFWIDLIERGDGVIFYHEDERGMMVGGFGGGISIEPITGIPRAVQLFHYYKPEWRGSVSVRRLVREFEKWSGERCGSMPRNHTLPLLDTNNPKTARFMRAMGYVPQSETWIKRFLQ